MLRRYKDLREELSIMSQLQHPRVVALVGVCLKPLAMVLKLAPRGSLRDHIDLCPHGMQSHMAHQVLYQVRCFPQHCCNISTPLQHLVKSWDQSNYLYFSGGIMLHATYFPSCFRLLMVSATCTPCTLSTVTSSLATCWYGNWTLPGAWTSSWPTMACHNSRLPQASTDTKERRNTWHQSSSRTSESQLTMKR